MDKIKKWKCVTCGYVYEGEVKPKICPKCKTDFKQFQQLEDKSTLLSKNKLKILIIGSGIAGYSAAKNIRKKNNTCEIEIISKDIELPYYKPILPKYLNNSTANDKLNITTQKWYEQNNIKLSLGKNVLKIDSDNKKVILEDNSEIMYDKAILAVGSHAYLPPISGKNKERVRTLRTLEDAVKLKNLMNSANNIVIIGGGLLGLETAYAISKTGIKITIIERNPILMHKHLDKTSSSIFKKTLHNNNIKVLTGESVKEILGFTKVTGVKLSNNKCIRCDLILFASGIRPNINIAEKSGLNYNKGIIINKKMETNIKDIFACGDCAELNNIVYGNWSSAELMGKIAGENALGENKQFKHLIPAFYFEGFGTKIFSCGNLNKTQSTQQARFVDDERKIFKRLYFKHDTLKGAILMGNTEKSTEIIDAINTQKTFNDIIKKYALM